MINRRQFLLLTTSLGLSYLLSGCNASEITNIILLRGSIPPQLLKKFQDSLSNNNSISFSLETQLNTLYKLLRIWQKDSVKSVNLPSWIPFVPSSPPPPASLITLGHFWLSNAVNNQLIDPLSLSNLSEWKNLPDIWKNLVTEQGKIWAAPYRWGTTVIAYRRDKFKDFNWTPKDWPDLWKPEVKGLISALDQPREIIGLTLKKLGYSYNTTDLNSVPNLKTELQTLNQQIKYYSSKYYLHPFVLGDTWLTVGWSNEILPLANNDDNIEVVIPASGTALWTDLWVKPQTQENKEIDQIALDWINFCWQPLAVNWISSSTKGTSPMIFNLSKDQIKKDLENDPFVNLPTEVLNQSEFIQPLPEKVTQSYLDLWTEMRNQGSK